MVITSSDVKNNRFWSAPYCSCGVIQGSVGPDIQINLHLVFIQNVRCCPLVNAVPGEDIRTLVNFHLWVNYPFNELSWMCRGLTYITNVTVYHCWEIMKHCLLLRYSVTKHSQTCRDIPLAWLYTENGALMQYLTMFACNGAQLVLFLLLFLLRYLQVVKNQPYYTARRPLSPDVLILPATPTLAPPPVPPPQTMRHIRACTLIHIFF